MHRLGFRNASPLRFGVGSLFFVGTLLLLHEFLSFLFLLLRNSYPLLLSLPELALEDLGLGLPPGLVLDELLLLLLPDLLHEGQLELIHGQEVLAAVAFVEGVLLSVDLDVVSQGLGWGGFVRLEGQVVLSVDFLLPDGGEQFPPEFLGLLQLVGVLQTLQMARHDIVVVCGHDVLGLPQLHQLVLEIIGQPAL